MATRTVARKSRTGNAALDIFKGKLIQFLTLKAQVEDLEPALDDLKKDLSVVVETEGYEDEKGNLWLDLDEPIVVAGKTIRKVKRQKDTTTGFDEAAATEVLTKKGLLEECQTTVVVFDEEEINRLYFEKKITKRELEKMFPTTTRWSFRPQAGR